MNRNEHTNNSSRPEHTNSNNRTEHNNRTDQNSGRTAEPVKDRNDPDGGRVSVNKKKEAGGLAVPRK
jgi:hypothetical protein